MRSLPEINKRVISTTPIDKHNTKHGSEASIKLNKEEFTLASDNKIKLNRPLFVSPLGRNSVLSNLGAGKLDLENLK